MLKFKFLISFISFIQVVPNILDMWENYLDDLNYNKCSKSSDKPLDIKNATQCVERNSFLSKEDNGSKCCFFSSIKDPIYHYKKKYGENWKKIVAQSEGYDLNISEEEIRKNSGIIIDGNNCQYVMKGLNNISLYVYSLTTIDGIVKYDCGEGEKIFNRKEFHPANKEEILDKYFIDSFSFSYTEKDCLKRGTKLSDDNYQICWCEIIPLFSEGDNEKNCVPYRISTFQDRLKKEMNIFQEDNLKVENKCTCSNNKGKINKGSYNSITGEVKVEINK